MLIPYFVSRSLPPHMTYMMMAEGISVSDTGINVRNTRDAVNCGPGSGHNLPIGTTESGRLSRTSRLDARARAHGLLLFVDRRKDERTRRPSRTLAS